MVKYYHMMIDTGYMPLPSLTYMMLRVEWHLPSPRDIYEALSIFPSFLPLHLFMCMCGREPGNEATLTHLSSNY